MARSVFTVVLRASSVRINIAARGTILGSWGLTAQRRTCFSESWQDAQLLRVAMRSGSSWPDRLAVASHAPRASRASRSASVSSFSWSSHVSSSRSGCSANTRHCRASSSAKPGARVSGTQNCTSHIPRARIRSRICCTRPAVLVLLMLLHVTLSAEVARTGGKRGRGGEAGFWTSGGRLHDFTFLIE